MAVPDPEKFREVFGDDAADALKAGVDPEFASTVFAGRARRAVKITSKPRKTPLSQGGGKDPGGSIDSLRPTRAQSAGMAAQSAYNAIPTPSDITSGSIADNRFVTAIIAGLFVLLVGSELSKKYFGFSWDPAHGGFSVSQPAAPANPLPTWQTAPTALEAAQNNIVPLFQGQHLPYGPSPTAPGSPAAVPAPTHAGVGIPM